MFIRKQINTQFLNVSEVVITDKDTRIKTILGSCVSIVIFVPRLKLSAICHARLPKGKCDPSRKNGFCYVDGSFFYMVDELTKRGANEKELVIKAFGGAQIAFSENKRNIAKTSIGQQNINQIETVLASRGLKLDGYDLGGKSGRKLIYNAHKNEVLIKPLTENTNTENEIALLLENFIFNR